jgi:transcriptional regulator with XRE-family HTH domain
MTELDQRRVAKAFGAALKSTRTNTGISQEKLAELVNIDRTCPSMLERGIRQPTLGRVIAIANALHIEPAAIVAATVTRLRPESATSSISQHGRSTRSTAQRQDSAPGRRCIPEREPLIFNGPRNSTP